MQTAGAPPTFHRVARFAVLAGGVASLIVTLYAGRHNSSRLLLGLFSCWVLAPFAVLLGLQAMSKAWTSATRAALHTAMLLVPIVTVVLYILAAPATKTPVFVMTPPISLVASLLIVGAAAVGSRSH